MRDLGNVESLENELRELRTEVRYPATPPLAATVEQRLRLASAEAVVHPSGWLSAGWATRAGHPSGWLKLGYAALAAIAIGVLVAVASPDARDVVAERLGLRGLRVISMPAFDTSLTRSDPRPLLGQPVGMEAAAARVAFPILTAAAALGAPDEVYVNESLPGGEVTVLYGPRPDYPEVVAGIGLLISQTPGNSIGDVYEKSVGPGTSVERLLVGGRPALWISGQPHRISYVSPVGAGQVAEARLAANVLALERGDLIVRIEGGMDRDAAARIATALR